MYVNDFCYYRNCLYTHRYKFSSGKKKGKESQYRVSLPEISSDPPIGLDRESGRDTFYVTAFPNGPLLGVASYSVGGGVTDSWENIYLYHGEPVGSFA